jgi:hypothetical protein
MRANMEGLAMRFAQFFSLDSPKAIKARAYGYTNAINYMAPAALAGVGNLCPHASPGCLALCLGWHSGQAGMVKGGRTNALNAVRRSRQDKARMFMRDRATFMGELIAGIERAQRKANREGLKLCVRLNGATDIAWEGVRIPIECMAGALAGKNVFEAFPDVQFVDYTKSVRRALRAASDPTWPANYHLTFSRSETNEADCVQVLRAGGNVAVVFANGLPKTYTIGHTGPHKHVAPVINGDEHDLRHLDYSPIGGGLIIGLSPKGNRAKADRSGFVVRP